MDCFEAGGLYPNSNFCKGLAPEAANECLVAPARGPKPIGLNRTVPPPSTHGDTHSPTASGGNSVFPLDKYLS
jgi:hypothetical protein